MMTPSFWTASRWKAVRTTPNGASSWPSFITSDENPWFAKAYVNRIWGRLLGHGFYEPVDNLGESQPQLLPKVHEALAGPFLATGYDVKGSVARW